jgi:hypothetical protein
MRACRNDNRVVKTLLLVGPDPELPAFPRADRPPPDPAQPRPDQQPHPRPRGAGRHRPPPRLGQATGHIDVGRESDPSVSIILDQVDVRSILHRAREGVRTGPCQTALGALLFEALEIPGDYRRVVEHKLDWRGTRRTGELVFGNVRRMTPDQLRCPDDHDFRVIIDYPFDEGSFGPHHDITTLDEFAASNPSSWTLVWLPSFLSADSYRALEDLVAIGIVLGEPLTYLQHLSVDKQAAARNLLLNLQREKRSLLLDVLEKAYGLAPIKDDDTSLDRSRRVHEPLRLLARGQQLATSLIAPNFRTALASYVPALLATRYPHHPEFRARFTNKPLVESLLTAFDQLCDQPDHRLANLKRDELDSLRGSLGALGVVRVTESAALLVTDGPLHRIERRREQEVVDSPSVAELTAWYGESHRHGLQPEALAVLLRCYARLYARTFTSAGRPWPVTTGTAIPGHVVLERPELPRDDPWSRALKLAGAVFGINVRSSNTADNLRAFETALDARLRELGPGAARLPELLADWLTALGLPDDGPRLLAAHTAHTLLRSLHGLRGLQQVEVLAGFTAPIGADALASSLASARGVVDELSSSLLRGTFEQLHLRQDHLASAAEILDELAALLHADEHEAPLIQPLRALAERATRVHLADAQSSAQRRPDATDILADPVLQDRIKEAPPTAPRRWDIVTASAGELDAMLAELRATGLAAAGPLRWQVRVQQRGG